LRHLDTMTTVTLGHASSGGLEQALDEIMEEEIPTLTLRDAVVHGYFNMGGLDDRVMWPASLPEVDALVPGSQKLIEFMLRFFTRDANGMVSGGSVCEIYSAAGVNPYMLQPVVSAINYAWAAITDLLDLDSKTMTMMSSARSQVEDMKAKMDKSCWSNCDTWLEEKLKDMKEHVEKKVKDAEVAMQESITEVLRLWIIVDLEDTIQKARASAAANEAGTAIDCI
ncbi:unnamed protein product, partial [Symbiodinium sp. CCMP2456]